MTCNANCAELSGLYANALNLTIRGTPKHYAAWHHDKLPALVSSKMPGRQMFLLHGQTLFRKKDTWKLALVLFHLGVNTLI